MVKAVYLGNKGGKMQVFYNYASIILAALGTMAGLTGYYLNSVCRINFEWLVWLIISATLNMAGLMTGKLIQRLNLSSHTDFLTGLWNRRYFYLRLDEEEARATRKKKSLCVAMVDLDAFKTINDIYGHAVGDILLCEIVAILKKHIRGTDIVARWGGDEFAILFSDTSLTNVREIMERVRCKVEKTFHSSYSLTISVGIISLEPDQNLRELLIKADQALYKAKMQKNSVITIGNL